MAGGIKKAKHRVISVLGQRFVIYSTGGGRKGRGKKCSGKRELGRIPLKGASTTQKTKKLRKKKGLIEASRGGLCQWGE